MNGISVIPIGALPMIKELTVSDEAFLNGTSYLSDELFLQKAYLAYLNREPDREGKEFYLQWFQQGNTRQTFLAAIRQSQEFKQETFDYFKYPSRLNIGCGFDIKPGYLNVDFQEFHQPDLVADMRNLSMLPPNYYEEIVAQDCLEHIPRTDTEPTLREWLRLLKPGGILKLRVPNLIGLLELLKSEQSIDAQERLVQNLFGTQAYTGDWHLTGFTEILLDHYLKKVGFSKTNFQIQDQWLFNVNAEKHY